MVGMITELHWKQIDRVFPGIHTFYNKIPRKKPNTFLELAWLYLDRSQRSSKPYPKRISIRPKKRK